MIIKVLGSVWKRCIKFEAYTKEALSSLVLSYEVQKITGFIEMTKYNVLKTPALVFD